MSQPGGATEEGTAGYRARFKDRIAAGHFRLQEGMWLSSVGIGTYLGGYDSATDELYREAIVRGLEGGFNVVDTAINYRFQRSERSIGAALRELAKRGIERSEYLIATKGGFLPFDSAPPADIQSYFQETFVKPGIAGPSDLVARYHCMTPSYLSSQIDSSRKNLELDTIDIYYVHNPETQLGEISREEFRTRMLRAFEALEEAAAQGKIRFYGTATWNGYRSDPQEREYLSLAEIVEIARKAGGEKNRFRVIQLPLNLAMPEALTKKNQQVGGETVSTLEGARRLGLTVMCSASILQGRLARNLPSILGEVFPHLDTDAQRALQFVRSTPGAAVALVGMKQVLHVEENLKVAEIPPAPLQQYARLFQG